MKKIILVSACLLGINTKYNGKNNISKAVLSLMDKFLLIPVCPEQLGGLSTPRASSEIQRDGGVYTEDGEDVTENFAKGADETLKTAKLYGMRYALLKEDSPSCGSHFIYDGSFTNKKIKGEGITAKLLKRNGIKVFSENDIEELINEAEE